MRVALAFLVVAVAMCAVSGQRGFGRRGFGGRGFGGRGLIGRGRFGLGFGGLGFGGLGFGGLGLGLGLGMPWGMPWGLGLGLGMPFIGKRDVEAVEKEMHKMSTGVTHCTYEHDMIKCTGHKEHKFECEVEPTFTTYKPTETHHFKNLTALPKSIDVKDNELVFNLFSFDKVNEEINDYTFLEKVEGKEEKFFFSMFFKEHEDIDKDINTFKFKSATCWNKFVNTVRSHMPGNVRFALNFEKTA